ncbi:hypothetical protein CsatB_024755 [Cannabis sativa]
MDLELAWNQMSANIFKNLHELVKKSKDPKSIMELAKDYRSLLKAASTILGCKDEIQSKMIVLIKQAHCLNKRVDDFHDKLHQNYNIPHFGETESFKDYLKDLQEFMTMWKEETEKGRRKGEKSLIEWLQELDQSQRKITFEAMKNVVIDLGTNVSKIITDFLLLVVILGDRKHIIKNLDDFKAMIKLLSVEKNKDNSIVIKAFLGVIQLVETTMGKRKGLNGNRGEETEIAGKIELEIMRMILKEILRLEVALCCPDLVMVLTDEVYLSMGIHLRNFFGTKLNDVNMKMNALRMEVALLSFVQSHKDENEVEFVKETMAIEVQNIWNKLDL